MSEVRGKFGIRAKVLKASRSAITGVVLTTFEIEYPRIILAELNTHRMLSKNSASSRAIPFLKMQEQLHARPVRFGQANPGMQDKGDDYGAMVWNRATAEEAWEEAKGFATSFAKAFYEAGYHKQVYNRLVEPFQMMKTIISGTEWANFFWLRNHGAADPTLQELARVMKEAGDSAEVQELQPGEWHLPYVDTYRQRDGNLTYCDVKLEEDGKRTTIFYPLEDAIKISCARCAAVSFRNEDYGLKKSREVYQRLVGDERKHASSFEHCGEPMLEQYADAQAWYATDGHINACNVPEVPETWQDGVSHMDRNRNLWSGNYRGFIQYRKLIPGENFTQES